MTEEQPIRARVKRERHVRSFAVLSHANKILLENAQQQRPGYFYECMTAILISAFKFEAYLNHAGASLFPFWDEMDRLPHGSKLNIIRSRLGIQSDNGARPYQTLTKLFQFRNAIVHGRDEHLCPPEVIEEGHIEELRRRRPLTCWEELCTLEFAACVDEDTEQIIREIHSAAGLPKADLSRGGHTYSIGLLVNV